MTSAGLEATATNGAVWSSPTMLVLSDVMYARLLTACASLGVPTPGALRLLLAVDPDEQPSMRHLARRIGSDPSYVTALVDTLESCGHVERRLMPSDRRVKLIRLTEAGAAVQAKARELLAEPPPGYGSLTASEALAFTRLLTKLTGATEGGNEALEMTTAERRDTHSAVRTSLTVSAEINRGPA